MSIVRIACFVVLSLTAVGCSKPTTGTVTGKVTVAGKPLKSGTISFLMGNNDSEPITVTLNNDGTYTMPDLPFGTYLVSVVPYPETSSQTMDAAASAKERSQEFDRTGRAMPRDILNAGAQPARGQKSMIAEKYLDPLKSGISLSVDAPTKEFNVDIP